MSLIQQALERTNRAQETRTTTPPVQAPQPWERDPMGISLEQEIIRVQQKHLSRRSLYRKIALGVLLVCLIAGLSYVGIRLGVRQIPFGVVPVSVTGAVPGVSQSSEVPQIPVKIYSGNIYRLTGITDLGGHAIAVINGRLLEVGDAVDSKAVVQAIGDGEVRLSVQGKELKLLL